MLKDFVKLNINIKIINFIHIYTGCPSLNNALRFLESYGRYGKMFQTKIVWFGWRYKKICTIDLTLDGVVKIKVPPIF